VALLAFAIEGIGCLLMALPLALPLALTGGAIAWAIQDGIGTRQGTVAILILLILYPPAVMCAEYVVAPEPPLLTVRSAVDIDAPPETVWRHVVSFADLPERSGFSMRESLIRFALESKARTRSRSAVRVLYRPFVEPIQIWDEPRSAIRGHTKSAPMKWILTNVHPKHLDNFRFQAGASFCWRHCLADYQARSTTWYTQLGPPDIGKYGRTLSSTGFMSEFWFISRCWRRVRRPGDNTSKILHGHYSGVLAHCFQHLHLGYV
jgi:hypothetical protein